MRRTGLKCVGTREMGHQWGRCPQGLGLLGAANTGLSCVQRSRWGNV